MSSNVVEDGARARHHKYYITDDLVTFVVWLLCISLGFTPNSSSQVDERLFRVHRCESQVGRGSALSIQRILTNASQTSLNGNRNSSGPCFPFPPAILQRRVSLTTNPSHFLGSLFDNLNLCSTFFTSGKFHRIHATVSDQCLSP
jgi:hypothetical protein